MFVGEGGAQDFEPDVVEWLLAMMGRFVFPTDDKDSWQVCLFLKGLGGSGKSTILKIIAAFYDPEDVGLIGNNIEGTFGLEGLYTAFVTLCMEMKGSFNLDQAVFQSMVSGEAVSVARKNKTAVKTDWSSPLGFAANESFPYQDNAGNMARRLVAVYFSKVPRRPDQRLMKNILDTEMPNILRKCVEAYLHKAQLYAKVDLWSRTGGKLVLPQAFHDLKLEMQVSEGLSEGPPLPAFSPAPLTPPSHARPPLRPSATPWPASWGTRRGGRGRRAARTPTTSTCWPAPSARPTTTTWRRTGSPSRSGSPRCTSRC